MISVTPETVFYFAMFGMAIGIFGFLVVAFIYYNERRVHPQPKHKHA